VRNDRFRYAEWDGGGAGSELYDYDKDPTESRILAGVSGHAETVHAMKALLRAG
jgi:iduronate 2-sulfatase